MNELSKTLTFVAVALVLTGAAFVSTRDRSVRDEAFNDQGQPFFPDFKDPLACTDLEVVDFDPSTATASRFQVMFKDKKWVIPSHYNYPADARDRLSKTAAAVMDLTKDTIRSDRAEDQEEMGVIDPLDTKITTLKGRGKRITLRDSSEKVLADFIIGNEIKGTSARTAAQHYVRVPGQKRTYGVNVKAEPSTRFADWIETNLLKVEASQIRKIVFDNYKVQEASNRRLICSAARSWTIDRKDASGPWTMAGLPAGPGARRGQAADPDRRPGRPQDRRRSAQARRAHRDLKQNDKEGIKLTATIVASLQSKGFFLTKDGQLLSDQGDVLRLRPTRGSSTPSATAGRLRHRR